MYKNIRVPPSPPGGIYPEPCYDETMHSHRLVGAFSAFSVDYAQAIGEKSKQTELLQCTMKL